MFVFFSTLSDLHKGVAAKPVHFTSSQRPVDSARSTTTTNLVAQNRKLAKDQTHSTPVKSSSSKKRSSSANVKLNIQFLSADGTKQKGDLLREEKALPYTTISSRELKKSLEERKPWPKLIPAWEGKAQRGQVGTVINGMNPMKMADNERGSHRWPQQAFKACGPSGGRPPMGRPSSVAEIQRWRYVAISKPLSPPGHHQRSSQVGSVVPHLIKDTPRSERRSPSKTFTTLTSRPVIFEARRERQSTIPAEMPNPDPGGDKGTRWENVRSPNVSWSSPILENPKRRSWGHECDEGQAKTSPILTTHHSTIPIISIPTAQTDTCE